MRESVKSRITRVGKDGVRKTPQCGGDGGFVTGRDGDVVGDQTAGSAATRDRVASVTGLECL